MSDVRRKLEAQARKPVTSPVLTSEEMDKLIRDKEATVGIGEK